MQKTTCTKWINKEYPERCAEFDRDKWLKLSKELPTKPMHFCIDRFEYPNQKGEYPSIFVNWHEAASLRRRGQAALQRGRVDLRLRGRGGDALSVRLRSRRDACVVDKGWRPFHESALRPRDGWTAIVELDRLWQGVPSGSQPRCKSPFGVYDMTGNVDEWTQLVARGRAPSILKGGYWGPVRTRCRPSTRSHDEKHTFYQQGFRCCTDPGVIPVGRAERTIPPRRPFRASFSKG